MPGIGVLCQGFAGDGREVGGRLAGDSELFTKARGRLVKQINLGGLGGGKSPAGDWSIISRGRPAGDSREIHENTKNNGK